MFKICERIYQRNDNTIQKNMQSRNKNKLKKTRLKQLKNTYMSKNM